MTFLDYIPSLEEEVIQTSSVAFFLVEGSSLDCEIGIWHTGEAEI